jgi:hypothetical protein
VSEGADKDGESPGLYLSWEELRAAINPHIGRDRFRALIEEKREKAGFPPFREAWGGFYWPKVRRWLDRDNEVEANGAVAFAEDGAETFDATPRKRARPQARPAQSAVLDGAAGGARPDGLPGSVHRFTPRRQR